MKKQYVFAISILVVIGFLFLLTKIDTGQKSTELSSREVALSCTTDMATAFHIHPELKIFINGQEVVIPENIGIKPYCMNALHTHDDLPLIHVESPVQKDFTLGDFFAVWEKNFNSMEILDFKATEAGQVKITVNGEEVDTFENTILRDKDKIVIEANN